MAKQLGRGKADHVLMGKKFEKSVPSLSLQTKKVSEKLVGVLLTMVFSAGHGKEYTLTYQISN